MNVQAMLKELEWLGVELRTVGKNLEYEGPEEAITPELLEQLKAHADLMAVCGKAEMVTEEDGQPAEVMCIPNTADPEACRLLAPGWEPKERCGKIIWKQPDNGFYYSQEMAAYVLSRGIGNPSYKSGAGKER
jgi:hypothetical protein